MNGQNRTNAVQLRTFTIPRRKARNGCGFGCGTCRETGVVGLMSAVECTV
ncbi:hypothetical protein [Brevibacterium samyangense]